LNNNSLIEYSLREDTIIMSMKFIDDNGNDLSIKLEMFFNKNPIFLKGWEVIDYQNKTTIVKIIKIISEKNSKKKYGNDIYKLTERMRQSGDIYRGPWERDLISPPIKPGRASQ